MDPDELVSELVTKYEQIVGEVVRPDSKERLFIEWMASVMIQERAIANHAANQNIPSRAEGKNLDALAELTYSKTRPAAQPASCIMRFEISEPQPSAILIPAGTRVTDAGKALVWATEKDVFIPIGETYIDTEVRCQTAGAVGNEYLPGQINALIDVYDYYSKCANQTASGGGSDAPDDDAYYELLRQSMDAYSCAGASGGYIYFAKKVSSEIADVVANSPQPGYVAIYVLMEDGSIASEAVKADVLKACSADEVRPMTDFVSVRDPEICDYDIRLTYYVPSGLTHSTAKLQEAVGAAVQEHIKWQCGKLGRDINPSRLIGRLMEAGVKRVALEAPVFTPLRDGSDGTVPQLARVGQIVVVNGGFEDE